MVTCVQLGNCPVSANPLEWAAVPYTNLIGDWTYVLIWGLVVSVVFIRTKSPMLTGLIGLLIFTGFLGTSTFTGSSTSAVFGWGFILLSVGVGTVVFYLIWTKLRAP